MVKELTEKQLYTAKLKLLRERYLEVEPLAFYRELFPEGEFEACKQLTGKPNGILINLNEEGKGLQWLIFDDLKRIKDYQRIDNVIMSPISYYGKSRTSKNASKIYAMVIDLDGQGLSQLKDTIHQMYTVSLIPPATYLILSGHGLHLYYVFDEPIPMKPHIQKELNKLKNGITKMVWNSYTSTIKKPQKQPITQGFRMVGSLSKLGKRYPVRAFKTGVKTSVEELVEWIPKLKEWDEYRIDLERCGRIEIEEAKKLFPEWYERRIVQGLPPRRWIVKRDLYDWWLRKLREGEGTVGHRYFCVMCLAMYAYKCGVSEEELKRDAYSLIPLLDEISEDDKNRFTKKDIRTALKAYRTGAQNYPRDLIRDLSAIPIEANKRNYRKQPEHMKIISAIRDIVKPDWRNKDGRPKGSGTKAKIIQQWRKANPEGRKIDCERATGLSRHTVLKWWDYTPKTIKEQLHFFLETTKIKIKDRKYLLFVTILLDMVKSLSDDLPEAAAKLMDKAYLELLFEREAVMSVALGGNLSLKKRYEVFWQSYLQNIGR